MLEVKSPVGHARDDQTYCRLVEGADGRLTECRTKGGKNGTSNEGNAAVAPPRNYQINGTN
jgi:hypothetical protein